MPDTDLSAADLATLLEEARQAPLPASEVYLARLLADARAAQPAPPTPARRFGWRPLRRRLQPAMWVSGLAASCAGGLWLGRWAGAAGFVDPALLSGADLAWQMPGLVALAGGF